MPEVIAERIASDFGLAPVVATEIEFYLHGIGRGRSQQEVVELLEAVCAAACLPLAKAEAERGPDQYEVSFLPSHDLARVISDTDRFKALMLETARGQGTEADFSAKPKRDIPGSGLHVHVHLEDASGRNVFFRDGEDFSPHMLHAIGGLLELMNPCMPVFAPRMESYERFLYTVNDYLVCPAAANVPFTVSWGNNNRTVAVRLPTKPADNKHLEHRVSGSDADVASVIEAVLTGMHYGLGKRCDPGDPIYGDASLPQYARPKLARSLAEALLARNESAALKPYLSLAAAT